MKPIFLSMLLVCCINASAIAGQQSKKDSTYYIQIALLLDVSGSMNSLLSQAQGYFWKMAEHLGNFQYQEKPTELELAIISYGHRDFAEQGHIQVLSDFTQNFDTLMNDLFLLQIGGGNEYCGQALEIALEQLSWKKGNHFAAIFIAGNEIFSQGSVPFEEVCKKAKAKGTLINTIYCGTQDQAKEHLWPEAADFAAGRFSYIDHKEDPERFKTPYDNKILQLYNTYASTLLDSTQVIRLPEKKIWQDISPVFRDQVIYQFQNSNVLPDVVDQFYNNDWQLADYMKESLPDDWKKLPERTLYRKLFQLSQKRKVARQSMEIYIQKVHEFVNISAGPQEEGRTLDLAIEEIVNEQLLAKGFENSNSNPNPN